MLSHSQEVLDRFIAACQKDERILAAYLYGSYARDEADAFSDLDMGLITTDESYQDFQGGRDSFIRLLGEPLFSEDFGLQGVVLFILSNGVECELMYGCESQPNHNRGDAYRALVDKKNLLTGLDWERIEALPSGQTEILRQVVNWFWHDLGHFIKAMGRGQLWWAQGQLEALRGYCVKLARLQHDFTSDPGNGEPYFKLERVLPVQQLAPLQETFVPMEAKAMLQAAWIILRYFSKNMPPLASAHGMPYPVELERLLTARLGKLSSG
jgi:predicted nucleotidyltransferase